MGPQYKFASLVFKSTASPNKVTNSGFGILMHGKPYSVGSRSVHIALDFSFLHFCYFFIFPISWFFLCLSSIYSILLAVYFSVVSMIRILLQLLLCAFGSYSWFVTFSEPRLWTWPWLTPAVYFAIAVLEGSWEMNVSLELYSNNGCGK